MAAGATECFGGLALCLGLGSRFASAALTVVMIVAYWTAERSDIHSMDDFVKATPFAFLFTVMTVLIFGPGRFSLDYVLQRFVFKKEKNSLEGFSLSAPGATMNLVVLWCWPDLPKFETASGERCDQFTIGFEAAGEGWPSGCSCGLGMDHWYALDGFSMVPRRHGGLEMKPRSDSHNQHRCSEWSKPTEPQNH